MFKTILKIRLTYMFIFLVVFFFGVLSLIPKTSLEEGALALFSVNTFVLAFYISPILSGQKSRIDTLAKTAHAESLTLYKAILYAHQLSKGTYRIFKGKVDAYIKSRINTPNPLAGEKEYEEIISYCLDYKGNDKDVMHTLEGTVIDNQTNRSNLNQAFGDKVFSHEWIVILIMYSVSMYFILNIDFGSSLYLRFVDALLAAGFTLVILILAKLSTLTHKRAKHIYDPYEKLIATNFREVD